MRRLLMTAVVIVAACSPGQELAVTTSSGGSGSSSTATSPVTSTGQATTTTTTTPATTSSIAELVGLAYEEVAVLDFPIQMTSLPGSELSYIATKAGRVLAFDGSTVLEEAVLDISAKVRNDGERGLLSIVLHPDDASRFFAHYSAGDGDTVVSEFTFSGPVTIDPGSERVLLRLDQPAANHNGGMIDIYRGGLFVGLGDGGGANDRFGNGQNTETLLGGMVRIGIEDPAEPGEAVLWQHGLRNPWRFWIDADLVYIADVGQNAFEEISVAPLDQGVNYGWPITEGLHCFRPASGCDTAGLTLPVVEVSHGDAGSCSITGGIVYRGSAIPEIRGHFFYSDFCGGYLRSFSFSDGEVVEQRDWTGDVGRPGSVVGFGVDGDGEMYVATRDQLLRVVAVRG